MKLKSFNIEVPISRDHYDFLASEINRQAEQADSYGLETIADFYRYKLNVFHTVNYHILDEFIGVDNFGK